MNPFTVLTLASLPFAMLGCSQKLDLDMKIRLANNDSSVSVARVHLVSTDGTIYGSKRDPVADPNGYINHNHCVDTGCDSFVTVDLSKGGEVFQTEVFLLGKPMLQSGGSDGEWVTPNLVVTDPESVEMQVLHDPERFKADDNPKSPFTRIHVITSPYATLD